jgi:hypothetical protein
VPHLGHDTSIEARVRSKQLVTNKNPRPNRKLSNISKRNFVSNYMQSLVQVLQFATNIEMEQEPIRISLREKLNLLLH